MGTIHGKRFFVEEYGLDCSESNATEFLKYFKRVEILRDIAEVSSFIFMKDDKSIIQKYGFKVNDNLLVNAAFLAVKYCKDREYLNVRMNEAAKIHFLRMCGSLIDKRNTETTKDPDELLLLHSYKQFSSQENYYNKLVRNYYMYQYLWSKSDVQQKLDIISEIKEMTGVSLRVASLLLFTSLKSSYLRPYKEDFFKLFNAKTGENANTCDHILFLKWVSSSFDEILNWKREVNVFHDKPVIDTKIKPVSDLDSVYTVVSHSLLYDKVTSGLYYSLAKKHDGGGKNNIFKTVFGTVFEKYVGELLEYYLPDYEVIPEIKYNRQMNKTVDWLLKKGDRSILIEVKQSALYLKAKNTGKINVSKTVFKAVKQLINTENEIKLKTYPELKNFNGIKSFIKIVVTYDRIYFANSIIKADLNKKIAEDHVFEIMDINNFESLLICSKNQKKDVWDILSDKIKNAYEMDYNEFLYWNGYRGNVKNEYLEKYYEEIFMGVKNA